MLKLAALVMVGIGLGGLLAHGKGCCSPKIWQGTEMSTTVMEETRAEGRRSQLVEPAVNVFNIEDDRAETGFTQTFRNISYDFENGTLATSTYRFGTGREPEFHRIIFRGGIRYVIKETKRFVRCLKQEKPLEEFCLSDEAEELREFTIGGGDDTLHVRSYLTHKKDRNVNLRIYSDVLADNCIPVSESIMGHVEEGPLFNSIKYINIEDSIDDPSVFDIPEECEEVDPSATATELLEPRYGHFPAFW